MPTAPAEYIVRLPLPESLLTTYEKEADRSGKPLEEFLAQHLRKTRALLAQEKPLIVTDADRRRMESALAKGFNDGSQLADACVKLATICVNGLDVTVGEQVIERLRTRCYGMTFDEFIQGTVSRLLENEVGLR